MTKNLFAKLLLVRDLITDNQSLIEENTHKPVAQPLSGFTYPACGLPGWPSVRRRHRCQFQKHCQRFSPVCCERCWTHQRTSSARQSNIAACPQNRSVYWRCTWRQEICAPRLFALDCHSGNWAQVTIWRSSAERECHLEWEPVTSVTQQTMEQTVQTCDFDRKLSQHCTQKQFNKQ